MSQVEVTVLRVAVNAGQFRLVMVAQVPRKKRNILGKREAKPLIVGIQVWCDCNEMTKWSPKKKGSKKRKTLFEKEIATGTRQRAQRIPRCAAVAVRTAFPPSLPATSHDRYPEDASTQCTRTHTVCTHTHIHTHNCTHTRNTRCNYINIDTTLLCNVYRRLDMIAGCKRER